MEVFDAKLDNLTKALKKVREGTENAQLILVTSQEIDVLCEQDNITQARRQMDGVLTTCGGAFECSSAWHGSHRSGG